MTYAVYIHIPFCEKICSYCDFCKVLYNEVLVDKYLDALEREIRTVYVGEKIKTLYIGGGTPSSLNIRQLKRLFEIINIFDKECLEEFTVEANFESTTLEKLALFKKSGVNRLSFGLESTNKKHLEFLNRNFDVNHAKEIVKYAKDIGIDNINTDLIYALKNETIEDVKKDLDFIIGLDIRSVTSMLSSCQ